MNQLAWNVTSGAASSPWLTDGTGPFRVEPRLDPKPWGSQGLARFGFPLPPGIPIGEALITSATVGMVLKVRPDLVYGAERLPLLGSRLQATGASS